MPATSGFDLFTFAKTANQITSSTRISHFPLKKMQKFTNSNIYYPKQNKVQIPMRRRVFLDVLFIGAEDFQKDYKFFLCGNYNCWLEKNISYKASLISSVSSER